MTDLIGLIGTTITLTKGLLEIDSEYNKAEYIKKISDLTIQLAQAQTEAAQMMTELRNLKAEEEERENHPLTYTGEVYRDRENVPYCPACYDNLKKRIHLKKFDTNRLQCPVCEVRYS
jgi:2-oxo-4-hydroxy-4-carboxy--5-ureidoimidazoline (OHCU) decarboxylase